MKSVKLLKSLVVVTGLLLAQGLACSVWGQGQLVLSNKWSVSADSRFYLGTASNWPRGMMINRATGHVLLPTTSPTNQVRILSGADGADLGSLNTEGLTGGHSAAFNILMGGVADDGVIYCGNLEVNTSVFRLWRWAAENPSVAPVCVFGPADPGPVQTRIGDSFCVRGAGTHTQIIASGTGSAYFTVFTTADGTNFTAHQFPLPAGVNAGEAARGVAFDGTNDAFYAGLSANSSLTHHISFDLNTGTSTLLEDITFPGLTMGCLTAITTNGFKLLAGVHDTGWDGSMHTLVVYDISDPATPVLADNGQVAFPGTPATDGNATGCTDFGAGMLVGFNTHNGLVALTVAVVTNPPAISVPPQDRTTYASGKAAFTVTATGTKPLAYQWYRNGATLAGETGSTLALNNVQAAVAGSYTVVITNLVGCVTSTPAKLSVANPAGYPVVILADNPIAYWRLDESSGTLAHDAWGAHDGAYVNATLEQPGYSLIDADTAIAVTSATPGGVSVPDSSAFNFTSLTTPFTLEAWVKFNGFPNVQRLFSDIDFSQHGGGAGIGFGVVDADTLRFTTYGVQDFDLALDQIGVPSLVPGRWYHIVGVSEGSGNFSFYLNGQPVGMIPFTGDPVAVTGPFCLGRSPTGSEAVDGQLDEMAVYGTALTSERVLAHYNARYGDNTAPLVRQQPQPTTNYVGLNATFSVVAEGSGTLSYQWRKDGVDLPGQYTDTLTLSPLDPTSVGNYSVLITGVGSTPSAAAHLTVLPAPKAYDLSSGLVLHLKWDNDYLDYSGRANHGTNVGATTFVADGKLGKALHVSTDTTSASFNYVTLGVRPDLQFGASANFSVAYWVRLPYGALPGDLPFLCNAVGSGRGFGYVFCPSYGAGGWRWTLYNDAGSGVNCEGAIGSINDGNWHHVAQTFDRTGNGVTYLDGVQVSSVSIAAVGNLDSGEPTNIGQDPTGTYAESGEFDLDDLGIWRRVLTPMEVGGMYVAGASNSVSFVSAPVRLQAQWVSGQLKLTWSGGLLQAADQVTGPYADLPEAASPYTVTPAGLKKFYRLKQ